MLCRILSKCLGGEKKKAPFLRGEVAPRWTDHVASNVSPPLGGPKSLFCTLNAIDLVLVRCESLRLCIWFARPVPRISELPEVPPEVVAQLVPPQRLHQQLVDVTAPLSREVVSSPEAF